MSDWVDVARVEELGVGESHVLEVDGTEIAVFNLGGRYCAIENICTHDGASLSGGVVEGNEIICPRHGARFCICTGEALTPPAYEPVATFPVRVKEGLIQVRDDRWD